MESEENHQTKKHITHVPRGTLRKIAKKLKLPYTTIVNRRNREDPYIENLILKELKKHNEVRVQNYELRKKIKEQEAQMYKN